MSYIKYIKEKHQDVIIDDMLSYYTAFKISDALIADAINSSAVNYLYTGKKLCIYDPKDNKAPAIDYREEKWYKSAYIVSEKKELIEFLRMVKRGEDVKKQQLDEHRRQVVSNFDGRVCDRIYEFFEKNTTLIKQGRF